MKSISRVRLKVRNHRAFSGFPGNIEYFRIDPNDESILGPKRVESTKVEAMMRRIAERLFMYDSVQRALVEDDMETADVKQKFLKEFLDARDAVPRSLPTSQNHFSSQLRSLLSEAQTGPESFYEMAEMFWTHQVRRPSTFHVFVRQMLILNLPQLAEDTLQSMLMALKSGVNASTYTLCLETSMHTNNHQWFLDLSKRVMLPPSEWGNFQAKFTNPVPLKTTSNESIDTEFAGKSGLLYLAEGFMKFRHPQLLSKVVDVAVGGKAGSTVKVLTVNLEAATRWKDENRAKTSFLRFEQIWNPGKVASVRFLLCARRNPTVAKQAAELVPQLAGNMQREYKRLLPHSYKYHHPYA